MAKRESKKISVGKIVSIVLISLSALLLVLSFSGRFFSGGFRDFCNFFVGSFGISLYGILAAVIVASALYLSGRRIHIPLRYVINFVAMYVVVVVFVHTLTTLFLFNFDYATYVGYVYNFYDYVPSFGGVVLGSVSYALQAGLTVWGASILLIALLAVNILFCVNFFNAIATHKLVLTGEMRSFRKTKEDKSSTLTQSDNDNNIGPSAHTEQVAQQAQTDPRRAEAMRILFENVPQNGQTTEYSDNVGKPNTSDYNNNRPFGNSSGEDDFDSIFNPNSANVNNDYNTTNNGNISGESFFNSNRQSKDIDDLFGFNNTPNSSSNSQSSNSYSSSSNSTSKQEEGHSYDIFRRVDITADGTQLPKVNLYDDKQDAPNNSSTKAEQNYTSQQPPFTNKQPVVEDPTDIFVDNADSSPFVDNIVTNDNTEEVPPVKTRTSSNQYNDEFVSRQNTSTAQPKADTFVPDPSPIDDEDDNIDTLKTSDIKESTDDSDYIISNIETPVNGGIQTGFTVIEKEKATEQKNKVHKYMKYNNPPVELLSDEVARQDYDSDYRNAQAQAIVKKLAVFGIKTEALDPIVGSSVTQFRLKVLSDKTRMSDFKTYADDLKSCLEAKDDIRIEAPIPGTNLVGIEVANRTKSPVVLRSILQSSEFKNAKGKLVFALGQDITGHNIVADLADMPHLLVAGTTGSGKSVVLNCMIVSLIYKYSPEYVRFIMVDPKLVELSRYNGLPHMLTSEAITVTGDALAGMDYLINEMEARYQLFREAHVGNITEYNDTINPKLVQKLPYIVLVVDELSDLMASSKKSLESKIIRLAQKARAAGIHLVLATQRPSVDVITGLIKANLPCRIALKVGSSQDSRTILDYGGAEKLLGKGDMLYVSSDSPNQKRIQGAYVGNDEIRQIVEYTRSQNEIYYPEDAYKSIFVSQQAPVEEEPADTSSEKTQLDPLCKKALYIWITKNNGKASIASAQRFLPIGFNRAGKIFESLVSLGCIEDLPANESNSKPRRVLVTVDDLDKMFPDQSID